MPPPELSQNRWCSGRHGRIARGAADTRTPTVLLMRGRRHLSRPRTAAPWQAAGRGGRRATIKRPALRRGAGWHRTGISPLTEPQTAVSCSASNSALDRAEGQSPAGNPTAGRRGRDDESNERNAKKKQGASDAMPATMRSWNRRSPTCRGRSTGGGWTASIGTAARGGTRGCAAAATRSRWSRCSRRASRRWLSRAPQSQKGAACAINFTLHQIIGKDHGTTKVLKEVVNVSLN